MKLTSILGASVLTLSLMTAFSARAGGSGGGGGTTEAGGGGTDAAGGSETSETSLTSGEAGGFDTEVTPTTSTSNIDCPEDCSSGTESGCDWSGAPAGTGGGVVVLFGALLLFKRRRFG